MSNGDAEALTIGGREVRITHPDKLYFSKQIKLSKLDLVRYYLSIAPGALAGIRDRPVVLKRFVNGAEADAFYQKRAPSDRPEWLRTVTLSFPSGRTAEEIVVDDAAGLAWIVNLGCIELHPHPVRSGDLDHPDELRVDLDPGPGVSWADVRTVALEVQAALEEMRLRGWPKTSGSRGMHVNVRIQPRWTFSEVRRAAVALSRAIERRAPRLASSKWWKEERHGVFLDYNQNAKDRTTCSAYSVRPVPDARVSTPLEWREVPDCEPADFTVLTVPGRFAERGDPHAGMDAAAGSLEELLELAAKDQAQGLGDAPWPPHFRKMEGEGPRVAPSRAKGGRKAAGSEGGAAALRATSGARARGRESSNVPHTTSGVDAPPTTPGADAPRAQSGADASRIQSGADASRAQSGADAPRTQSGADAPRTQSGARARRSKMPLVVVANSPNKEAAMAGLERWKIRHPEAAKVLAVDDVLVDSMRGRSSTWTRVRVNLRNVPEEIRPSQETPDPDDDPTRGWRELRAGKQRSTKGE